MRRTVGFKSVPENFEKEEDGRKPNTIRKKDLKDERHMLLGSMMAVGYYGQIEITNSETNETFRRTIIDVTDWDGWLIISWRHRRSR